MQIVNVHSPISSKPNLVKVCTHPAIHNRLAMNAKYYEQSWRADELSDHSPLITRISPA